MKYKTLITEEGKFLAIKHDGQFYTVAVEVPELYPNDFCFADKTNVKPTIVELTVVEKKQI